MAVARLADRHAGDVDLASVGALVAEPARCKILLALNDGRALPASRLAAEAGVSAATASSHLGKLTDAGLLAVEPHGRHRYYRLVGPQVGRLLEALQQFAPAQPVRSLRHGTRAQRLREARTCYDHLAGRLGVSVMAALIERGYLIGGDGHFDPDVVEHDPRAGFGHDVDYALSSDGADFFHRFGVQIPPRRPVIRYCVDWSEQRHHLSGGLGSGLLDRMLELDWVQRTDIPRTLTITDAGHRGLSDTLGVELG
jgi:DNA-binding transcriptional ArsR family regulator